MLRGQRVDAERDAEMDMEGEQVGEESVKVGLRGEDGGEDAHNAVDHSGVLAFIRLSLDCLGYD